VELYYIHQELRLNCQQLGLDSWWI